MQTHTANVNDAMMEKLAAMQAQMAYLVERQKKQEEMISEFMPIVKEMMGTATVTLDGWDKKGYFQFFNALGGVGERILTSYSAEDVRQLGDAVVNILNTVRALTQPQVLGVLGQAANVLEDAQQVQPLGLVGMVRASKDEEVQKGMAVLMELLRHVGRAAGTLDAVQRNSPASRRRAGLSASTAPRRKALGVERTPVAPVNVAPPSGANGHNGHNGHNAPAEPAAAAAPVMLDGVAFTPDGHLADVNAWNRELAVNLAAALGVTLEEAHWKVIDFARADYLGSKMSPNIRRLTQGTGVATKDLYALFPKAPARTVAKVAGIPKPAGCI